MCLRIMSDAHVRIYAAAHTVFAVLSRMLVTDRCEGAPAILANPDKSWMGMEYISEKLMKCHYSSSAWRLLPGVLGLAFSVVMLQHLATFDALPAPPTKAWPRAAFVALVIATSVGWGLIVDFDHRPAFVADTPEFVWHFVGVGIFLVSFCVLHFIVSWRYAVLRAMTPQYADLRRCSYVATDALYVAMCVVFCVTAQLNHVYHAILLEYMIFLLFLTMNTASFVILVRICAWREPLLSAPSSP